MGIASVAVYSDADRFTMAGARWPTRRCASVPRPPAESYLNVDAVIAACKATGAEAVHPGYGFLVGEYRLCRTARSRGHRLHRAHARSNIEAFGLKHTARELAKASGVPLLPGTDLLANADEALHRSRNASAIR